MMFDVEYSLQLSLRMTSYRETKKDDSSDDDDIAVKRVKKADDYDGNFTPSFQHAPAKKAASRNLWADVVQEEELAIKSNIMDVNDYKSSNLVKIRRGAETYTIPAQQLEENAVAFEAGQEMEEGMSKVAASLPSDDPFGDTVDLAEVEGFGVGPSSGRREAWQPRRPIAGSKGGGWMGKCRGGDRTRRQMVKNEAGEEDMDFGEGQDEPAASKGGMRGGWRGRGPRGGGFVPRGRGGNWRGSQLKRRWNDPKASDPIQLMDNGYSLAGLIATEFLEGLTPKELGEQIAKALGERITDTVVQIVEAVGEKKALELFEETKKAEQAGGLKVADGSRRRTPGGVYILLFKMDVDVDPSVKAKIFEQSKEAQRNIVKAKRRKAPHAPTDVAKGLDQLQQMLEDKKKELQEAATKEEPADEAKIEEDEELDYGEESRDSMD